MPHVRAPNGFDLKPNEAIRLKDTPEGGLFRVTRALTPAQRRNAPEITDAIKVALLQVGPWQPGKKYFSRETFTVKYVPDTNSSWVQWKCGGIANGASLHGRTQFADGTFSSKIQPRWASRCLLLTKEVEVVYEAFEPSRDGIPAGKQVPMQVDWCWAITFVRVPR